MLTGTNNRLFLQILNKYMYYNLIFYAYSTINYNISQAFINISQSTQCSVSDDGMNIKTRPVELQVYLYNVLLKIGKFRGHLDILHVTQND